MTRPGRRGPSPERPDRVRRVVPGVPATHAGAATPVNRLPGRDSGTRFFSSAGLSGPVPPCGDPCFFGPRVLPLPVASRAYARNRSSSTVIATAPKSSSTFPVSRYGRAWLNIRQKRAYGSGKKVVS